MIGSSRSYAIGMAHFHIAGGWKTLFIACASYLAVVISVASWVYYDARGTAGPAFTGAAVMLLVIVELLLLLFLGMLRISGAVRLDFTTRMIESHRLMPVSNWRAATGYVLGSTAHALALALLNLMFVYVFAVITGSDLTQVTLHQAVIALFVLFVWSAALLGAFYGKVYGAMIAVLSPIGGAFMYKLLPGLALLITPLMGDTIFHFGSSIRHIEMPYAVAFAAQIAFVALFFSGACRAYRGTYATTFSRLESLALIGLWSTISIAGIALWDSFRTRMFGPYYQDPELHSQQVIASIIMALLIALLPIRTLTVIERRGGRHLVGSVLFLLAIVGAITVIPLGLLEIPKGVLPPLLTSVHFALTAAVVAAHVATAYLIFRIMRRAKAGPTILAMLIVGFALWIVPLIVEFLRMWMDQNAYHDLATNSGVASTFSPVGMLAFVWTPDSKIPSMAGLVWIMLVPVLLGLLMYGRRGKRKAQAVTPLAAPALIVPAAGPISPDPPESLPS